MNRYDVLLPFSIFLLSFLPWPSFNSSNQAVKKYAPTHHDPSFLTFFLATSRGARPMHRSIATLSKLSCWGSLGPSTTLTLN